MNNSTAKAKPKMTVKNGVVYGDALSAQEKKRIVMQKKKDRKAKKMKSAENRLNAEELEAKWQNSFSHKLGIWSLEHTPKGWPK